MMPGFQDTKSKAIAEAVSKFIEVPHVELILGLKALNTYQSDILLHGNNKSSAFKGIGRSKFTALFSAADASFPGVLDYIKDCRNFENPWDSRFEGTGKEWCVDLGTSHFMKQHFCVLKFWKYCIDSADKVMYGTIYGTNVTNDWFVYHNALYQITCAETIAWMKT